jgi:hypothetical protein
MSMTKLPEFLVQSALVLLRDNPSWLKDAREAQNRATDAGYELYLMYDAERALVERAVKEALAILDQEASK